MTQTTTVAPSPTVIPAIRLRGGRMYPKSDSGRIFYAALVAGEQEVEEFAHVYHAAHGIAEKSRRMSPEVALTVVYAIGQLMAESESKSTKQEKPTE